MSRVVVTAVGADRPGIVAAVTGVLVDHGCNLEDSSMTILGGQFAMMLVVDAPDGLGAAELEAALAEPAAALDLVVAVRPVLEPRRGTPSPEAAGDPWTVSVYGADHPGIVHGVAELLAGERVNICNLSTRVIGDPDRPVYAMVLEVSLPPGVVPDELGRRLAETASRLGVDATLHASDADIL